MMRQTAWAIVHAIVLRGVTVRIFFFNFRQREECLTALFGPLKVSALRLHVDISPSM
jgi:uncharacterized membrane protein